MTRTLATFDISTFASGEVDLTHLERTVFYATPDGSAARTTTARPAPAWAQEGRMFG
jgi:hypothetical protein